MQSDSLVLGRQRRPRAARRHPRLLDQAGQHLRAATADLDAVEGDTPFIGSKCATPATRRGPRSSRSRTTYDEAEPVLDALPDVLGADGDRNYLVAIMNPAERATPAAPR